ncbi:unnamed protein product [Amoebophrya sp. A25]|nr:unnamed protein product [Amoebophrya sp. A25]|eukprot:GSA25T00014781001.1
MFSRGCRFSYGNGGHFNHRFSCLLCLLIYHDLADAYFEQVMSPFFDDDLPLDPALWEKEDHGSQNRGSMDEEVPSSVFQQRSRGDRGAKSHERAEGKGDREDNSEEPKGDEVVGGEAQGHDDSSSQEDKEGDDEATTEDEDGEAPKGRTVGEPNADSKRSEAEEKSTEEAEAATTSDRVSRSGRLREALNDDHERLSLGYVHSPGKGEESLLYELSSPDDSPSSDKDPTSTTSSIPRPGKPPTTSVSHEFETGVHQNYHKLLDAVHESVGVIAHADKEEKNILTQAEQWTEGKRRVDRQYRHIERTPVDLEHMLHDAATEIQRDLLQPWTEAEPPATSAEERMAKVLAKRAQEEEQ